MTKDFMPIIRFGEKESSIWHSELGYFLTASVKVITWICSVTSGDTTWTTHVCLEDPAG